LFGLPKGGRVVMEISPHNETSPAVHAEAVHAEQTQSLRDGKGVFGEGRSGRSRTGGKLGVFAEILAGLTAKRGVRGENTRTITGTPESRTGLDVNSPAFSGKTGRSGLKKNEIHAISSAQKKQAASLAGFSAEETEKAEKDRGEEAAEAGIIFENLFVREAPAAEKTEKSETVETNDADAFALRSVSGKDAEGSPPGEEEPPVIAHTGENEDKDGILKEKISKGKNFRENFPGERAGDAYGLSESGPEISGAEISGPQEPLKELSRKDGRGSRIAEARNKKKDRSALVVEDLLPASADPGRETGQSPLEGQRPLSGGREAELTVELRGREAVSEKGGREAGPGNAGAFENLLARGLEQDLSAGIVREARFVLRDGNEGTIKLSLKPESLGNVKIRLEMAENKITGHIVVESEEALRAFEREIHSLEQAFRDSGFEGAELDFSLAQGRDNAESRQEYPVFPNHRRGTGAPEAASLYDAAEREEFITGGVFRLNGRVQVNMLI
jgi:hypothetical protein